MFALLGDRPQESYGSIFLYNDDMEIPISSPDLYEPLSSNVSLGSLKNAQFTGTGLTVLYPGEYLVTYSVSAYTFPQLAKEFEFGISVNNNSMMQGAQHAEISSTATGRDTSISGSAIFPLKAYDTVSLKFSNHDDTTNLFIEHLELTLSKIN